MRVLELKALKDFTVNETGRNPINFKKGNTYRGLLHNDNVIAQDNNGHGTIIEIDYLDKYFSYREVNK